MDGNAKAGGDGAIAVTLTRRCDTVMTGGVAAKALLPLVFSPPIRFLSQALPRES